MSTGFALHPQLAADAVLICDLPLCQVLLMKDARFPWIILVPRRAGIVEFHNLDDADRVAAAGEIAVAGAIVQDWAKSRGGCDKMNIAMIGNIVPQLHIHILARTRSDSEWPLPVWGRGKSTPYSDAALSAALAELAAKFRAALEV